MTYCKPCFYEHFNKELLKCIHTENKTCIIADHDPENKEKIEENHFFWINYKNNMIFKKTRSLEWGLQNGEIIINADSEWDIMDSNGKTQGPLLIWIKDYLYKVYIEEDPNRSCRCTKLSEEK